MEKHSELKPTGLFILQFVETLPKQVGSPHAIYMDNYFTSINLFRVLRERGFRACGTTRAK